MSDKGTYAEGSLRANQSPPARGLEEILSGDELFLCGTCSISTTGLALAVSRECQQLLPGRWTDRRCSLWGDSSSLRMTNGRCPLAESQESFLVHDTCPSLDVLMTG